MSLETQAPVPAKKKKKKSPPVVIREDWKHITSPWLRFRLYLNSIFVDHAIFRWFFNRRKEITPRFHRSSQPYPYQLRQAARAGVRTVINLRGPRDCGSYYLEADACERLGLKLIDFQIFSRDAPTREKIEEAKTLFETVEYPVLVHCKSGADRAGMMAALYMLLAEGRSADDALDQLSFRFGHIRQAKTGILDRFVELYRDEGKGTDFLTWARTKYDRAALKASFKPRGWADAVVDFVLRRE